jgi:hypothetical protein
LCYYYSADVNKLFISLENEPHIGMIDLHEAEVPEIVAVEGLSGLNCLDCRLGLLATESADKNISLYDLDKQKIVREVESAGG